ncbi:DUF4259 domain-containing protein [Nonomuraea polychroma]|uniref:DUF4259 domain-containing protein n=1 Tax=Nonomuraea polychroma TaxID=46176 RepID=UPI003D9401DA
MEAYMGTWGADLFGSDTALDILDAISSTPPENRVEFIYRIFESAIDQANSVTPTIVPEEVIAAASIVAANLPGGETVSWGEEAEGISRWLPKPVPVAVAASALDALNASLPTDGWWWRSWQNASDRAQMQDALDRVRSLLATISRS